MKDQKKELTTNAGAPVADNQITIVMSDHQHVARRVRAWIETFRFTGLGWRE